MLDCQTNLILEQLSKQEQLSTSLQAVRSELRETKETVGKNGASGVWGAWIRGWTLILIIVLGLRRSWCWIVGSGWRYPVNYHGRLWLGRFWTLFRVGTFAPGFLPELLGIPVIIREVRFGSPFDLPMMLTSSVNCSCCSATATMWLHSLYDEYIGHWVSQLKPPFI